MCLFARTSEILQQPEAASVVLAGLTEHWKISLHCFQQKMTFFLATIELPTHRKPVVCESGADLVLLVQFLFATDRVFHVVQSLQQQRLCHQKATHFEHMSRNLNRKLYHFAGFCPLGYLFTNVFLCIRK